MVIFFFFLFFLQHMVQAGVGPFPGAPTGYPPAPANVGAADSLSMAVAAVKAEQVSQMKPDGAPPPVTSAAAAAQIYLQQKKVSSFFQTFFFFLYTEGDFCFFL